MEEIDADSIEETDAEEIDACCSDCCCVELIEYQKELHLSVETKMFYCMYMLKMVV